MNKKIIVFILLTVFMIPITCLAAPEDYISTGLQGACQEEQIAFNHPDYKESEEKANIYLFRGSGCSHCYEFLTYLEAITEEYGKYFNVISFEVWDKVNHPNNQKLLERVAKKLGDDAGGVPYIVIGKHSWAGYSESLNEEIYQAIQEEYENKNKNDIVINAINYKRTFGMTDILVVGGFILIIFLIIYARRKTKIEEEIIEE